MTFVFVTWLVYSGFGMEESGLTCLVLVVRVEFLGFLV